MIYKFFLKNKLIFLYIIKDNIKDYFSYQLKDYGSWVKK